MQLVLSLFPGLGLLDRAFEEMGFCIVRGPDLIWGGDIRAFRPPAGVFGGVIGGPPCQLFSIMKRLNPRAGEKHGNMIPEFERCVREASPEWFVMENVPDAPEPVVAGYEVRNELIRDHWVGGETSRMRRFSFGTRDGRKLEVDYPALCRPDPGPAILAGGGGRSQPVAIGGSGKRKKAPNGVRPGPSTGKRASIGELLAAQGFPTSMLDDVPLTSDGKRKAIGNGVPHALGIAIAKAVRKTFDASKRIEESDG